jgi:hypothetical protein
MRDAHETSDPPPPSHPPTPLPPVCALTKRWASLTCKLYYYLHSNLTKQSHVRVFYCPQLIPRPGQGGYLKLNPAFLGEDYEGFDYCVCNTVITKKM